MQTDEPIEFDSDDINAIVIKNLSYCKNNKFKILDLATGKVDYDEKNPCESMIVTRCGPEGSTVVNHFKCALCGCDFFGKCSQIETAADSSDDFGKFFSEMNRDDQ